jgi:hypothetical protein
MTAGDTIKRALRLIGALDAGADPDAAELADGLVALNGMTASLSAGRNAIHAPVTVTHSLTSGTAAYTIGSTGDIDTARPNKILAAWVRISGLDYPLSIEPLENYAARPVKTTGAIPESLYLEMGYPLATITLYPVPTEGDLHLKLWAPLPTYTAAGDDLALPGEYAEALAYNLAGRLAPEYGREIPQTVAVLADSSLRAIKALNAQPVPQINIPFGGGSRFDINEG